MDIDYSYVDSLDRSALYNYLYLIVQDWLPTYVHDKMFENAWEDGHASGNHEVAMRYYDLLDVVETAYNAGLATGSRRD